MGHSTASGRTQPSTNNPPPAPAQAQTPNHSVHPESYYYSYWDEFLRTDGVDRETFIDMEKELNQAMQVYNGLGISERELNIFRKYEAQKIAERGREIALRQKAVWRKIQRGDASLGYTTDLQERQAQRRYLERYEFNSLQLRDFKRKYGV